MKNQDFLQFSTINSPLPNLGQHQINLLPSDLIQTPDINLNRSGSFSDQTKAEIVDNKIKVVDYNQYVHENVFGKSTSEFLAPTTTSETSMISDKSDPLTGDITSVNNEAVLNLAVTDVKQQLESFTTDKEFLDKMNLPFGDDWQPQKADVLIQDLVTGEAMPKIEILPAANLNANGAFGKGTIYISEKFLSKNATNPEAVASVLLEETGHFVDQELNRVDSPGDEGDIFARLVQGETIAGDELTTIKAEDDSATILLKGKKLAVELAESPYQGMSADAAERWVQAALADAAASYPGYDLAYDPSAPEYNEDPAVVQLWQQRMQALGYAIEVDGYYGEQSAQVVRQFQADNGLTVDGYVGPDTWSASFSPGTPTAASEIPSPSITAEEIEAYESLYVRELYKESDILERNPVYAETTWNMTAQEMLVENKDFLNQAAERYGIDGRAIAGAIRWEYEKNNESRWFDERAYNKVQETGSLDVHIIDNVPIFGVRLIDGRSVPLNVDFKQLNGNGWGKMHYHAAQEVLKASGEKVPDDRTLARMLALPTSAIDLIARSMRQAVDAYWEVQKEDISNKPEIIADLYNGNGFKSEYENWAKDTIGGDPPTAGNAMGKWVEKNLDSLVAYETQGRLFV